MHEIDPKLAPFVSDILMNDERYRLHNWEKNNIFPKQKDFNVAQLVGETILSLRCFLIDQKVNEFKAATYDNSLDNTNILEDVLNYSNLKMLLSRKLNRVL
jgi:DNA primase